MKNIQKKNASSPELFEINGKRKNPRNDTPHIKAKKMKMNDGKIIPLTFNNSASEDDDDTNNVCSTSKWHVITCKTINPSTSMPENSTFEIENLLLDTSNISANSSTDYISDEDTAGTSTTPRYKCEVIEEVVSVNHEVNKFLSKCNDINMQYKCNDINMLTRPNVNFDRRKCKIITVPMKCNTTPKILDSNNENNITEEASGNESDFSENNTDETSENDSSNTAPDILNSTSDITDETSENDSSNTAPDILNSTSDITDETSEIDSSNTAPDILNSTSDITDETSENDSSSTATDIWSNSTNENNITDQTSENDFLNTTSDIVDATNENNLTDKTNDNASSNTKFLSTLNKQLVKYHVTDDDHCILILKYPLKLYFYGKLSVTVLSGAIEVLGHILETNCKKEFDIYSLRGCCLLCLETLPLPNKTSRNFLAILNHYIKDNKLIEKFCANIEANDSIIAVKNIKNKMVTYLKKHVEKQLYPKIIEMNYKKRPLYKLEKILSCYFETDTHAYKTFKKNEDWDSVLNAILRNLDKRECKTFLCGGKSVGKSVLLRYMINNLLNKVDKVVCIDLDPDQSEFTIGGCVSVTVVNTPIFGPNYTHLRNPQKSFFIGEVNVMQSLDKYVQSVKALIEYCEENISKDIPWLINYMGFTKSIGTDLIVSIIKLIAPNLVVQIESKKHARNYVSLLSDNFVSHYDASFNLLSCNKKLSYYVYSINSQADKKITGEWEFEPRQIREMSILSYFSQILDDKNEITAVSPYSINLSSIQLHHHIDRSEENILPILNGNLVGLCSRFNEAGNDNENNKLFNCFGFGIICGIDENKYELYLLTPVSQIDLEAVTCLVMGNIFLPTSVLYFFMRFAFTSVIPKRSYALVL